ncbi:50S ribosomal protein L30 [Nitritalea halalkaliphila LW7]|uniref:Large ribosomal subunit protein uL30 n=1 Tax=Nitritalea halalkaliphila LW7 TaxID=1189621 RepID=I5C9Z1_9BACT|nr:50S ribosomal protein L30 [Nitritalea halalkaliphila]EIM78643.1 50S ribosomal protein L30 [Nitritalea halalkaliphila LW7]
MAKVKITQVRSTIKRPKDQKATIIALGLGKMNKSVVKETSPQIEGMIKKISHLVKVEEA